LKVNRWFDGGPWRGGSKDGLKAVKVNFFIERLLSKFGSEVWALQ